MNSQEFVSTRYNLGKTQKEMAELLGISLRSVHAYEQGWRNVPATVERQILLLVFLKASSTVLRPCWELEKCPSEKRERCPAWEFKAGTLCWFINGTICQGKADQYWDEKLRTCRKCQVFEPVNKVMERIILNNEAKPNSASCNENDQTRSLPDHGGASLFLKSKNRIKKEFGKVFGKS